MARKLLPWEKDAVQVARQEGVPASLLLALIRQESGGNPNAVSPAGARGYTQLMPGTARGLGVDPSKPRQNLVGGARYLKQQLERFGSPELALSAYNSGPGGAEAGGSIEHFPETEAYVQRVMQFEKMYQGLDGGGAGALDVLTGASSPLSPEPSGPTPGAAPQAGGGNILTRRPGPGLKTLGELISKVGPLSTKYAEELEQQASSQAGDTAATTPTDATTVPPTSMMDTPPADAGAPTVDGLNGEFMRRLNLLFDAVQAAGGSLSIYSGARDAAKQQTLWEAAVKKYGSEAAARKWVAPPGKSHHDPNMGQQTGFGPGAIAADLRGDLAIAHKLAPRFGLVFPLSNEAWHIEPAGTRGK